MNLSDIGEIIKALAPIFTAGSAVVGVVIAARGLNRWQKEMIGRRQTELAEEVLSGFYQMRDIISSVRAPIGFGGEGLTRGRGDHETEEQAKQRDRYFIPIERLNHHGQFIADLFAKGYRMKAMFGSEAEKPFVLLREVLAEIRWASLMMMMSHRTDSPSRIALWEKWENTIRYSVGDDDLVEKRVEDAIISMERICRPVLEGRKGL
jgi:hypothetical protein